MLIKKRIGRPPKVRDEVNPKSPLPPHIIKELEELDKEEALEQQRKEELAHKESEEDESKEDEQDEDNSEEQRDELQPQPLPVVRTKPTTLKKENVVPKPVEPPKEPVKVKEDPADAPVEIDLTQLLTTWANASINLQKQTSDDVKDLKDILRRTNDLLEKILNNQPA